MTDTIYLVTDGEYSDYHVVGVFTSLEKAETVQRLYPDSRIEEYDLDIVPDHPPGMVSWLVRIFPEVMSDISVEQVSPIGEPSEHYHPGHGHRFSPEVYIVRCWARDAEHAKKIALDKFYQFQATQQGIAL